MPEHLRALIYILVLATVVFAFARAPATASAITPSDFKRRRNLWFAITLIAFLSGNFWIYILLSAVILLIALPAEENRVALFLALLFAVPPVTESIGGLGVLEQLFPINHVRLLCLTVLFPTFLYLVSRPDRLRFGRIWPDKFLLGFLAVNLGVALYVTTFTNVLRHNLFLAFLEIFLPYYVASRGLRELQAFRDTLTSLVVAALVLSAIAIFEAIRSWLLYSALIGALDVSWGLSAYLGRVGLGLRAQASTGHAHCPRFRDRRGPGCHAVRPHARAQRQGAAPRHRTPRRWAVRRLVPGAMGRRSRHATGVHRHRARRRATDREVRRGRARGDPAAQDDPGRSGSD